MTVFGETKVSAAMGVGEMAGEELEHAQLSRREVAHPRRGAPLDVLGRLLDPPSTPGVRYPLQQLPHLDQQRARQRSAFDEALLEGLAGVALFVESLADGGLLDRPLVGGEVVAPLFSAAWIDSAASLPALRRALRQ